MTWNAGSASDSGTVSGATSPAKSATVLGHPWVSSSGTASLRDERACTKWTFWPSISVTNCGCRLSRSCSALQSNVSRQ
jgi:hypothetical protein